METLDYLFCSWKGLIYPQMKSEGEDSSSGMKASDKNKGASSGLEGCKHHEVVKTEERQVTESKEETRKDGWMKP